MTSALDLDFLTQLSNAGVIGAARALGLDFDAAFGPLCASPAHPYRRYRWHVNADEFGTLVIHAAPPEEEMGWAPWERWRSVDGAVRREAWVSEPGRRWRALDPDGGALRPRFAVPPAGLSEALALARVDDAARALGFDAQAELLAPLSAPMQAQYAQFRWAVIPHWLAADGPVIYALPPMHRADAWPWESWYRDGAGRLTHHVHYTAPHPRSQGTWRDGAGSLQRPPEVMGVTWHWHDQASLAPALGSA